MSRRAGSPPPTPAAIRARDAARDARAAAAAAEYNEYQKKEAKNKRNKNSANLWKRRRNATFKFLGNVCTAAMKAAGACSRRGHTRNVNNTNIQPPRQAKLVEHIVAAQQHLLFLKEQAQDMIHEGTLQNRLDNLNRIKQDLNKLHTEYDTFRDEVPQQAVSWIFNNYTNTLYDIDRKRNEIIQTLTRVRAAQSFYEAQEKEAERRWMASSEYRQWQKDQKYYARVQQQQYTKQQIDTAFTMWWQDGDGANIYKNTSWIAERAMEDARDALEYAEWILKNETGDNDIVVWEILPYRDKAHNAVVVATNAFTLARKFLNRAEAEAKAAAAATNKIRAGVINMQKNAVQIWFNEAEYFYNQTVILTKQVVKAIDSIIHRKEEKNARNAAADKQQQEWQRSQQRSQQRPRQQAQQQQRPQPQQQPRPQPQQPPPPPKKPTPDFYKVMGILKAATATEIKKAYRTLAIQLHPDKCKEDKDICEKKFKELNQANMVLSVPKWKGKYDTINGNYTYEDLEREMEQDVADGAVRGGGRSRTMRRKRMGTSDALK